MSTLGLPTHPLQEAGATQLDSSDLQTCSFYSDVGDFNVIGLGNPAAAGGEHITGESPPLQAWDAWVAGERIAFGKGFQKGLAKNYKGGFESGFESGLRAGQRKSKIEGSGSPYTGDESYQNLHRGFQGKGKERQCHIAGKGTITWQCEACEELRTLAFEDGCQVVTNDGNVAVIASACNGDELE